MTSVQTRSAQPGSTGPGFLDLFRRNAALAPDAPAVVHDGEVTSFEDLDRAANRLAHHLRTLGVGAETVVGILSDRSPRLAVAVLGVLKAGGVFLTLDPQYPPDRIAFMLADSAAPVLLTTAELAPPAEVTGAARTVLLDALPDTPDHDPEGVVAPEAAAYVVYTSGSTGQPKGAVIEHRSLVAFARDTAERLQLGAGDRFLQFASPGFDVLVEELFPVWLAGGAVVFPPPSMAGPALDLTVLVARERLTVMELPAAFWHEWVRELDGVGEPLPASLRLVIVGAERVLPERLVMWQKLGVPLMHVYGITETTVSSTFFRLPAGASEGDLRHLPIGTALPSCDLWILDEALEPVPQGAVGELYIGGVMVGRGYLGRLALTAARFVADPAGAGGRLYRSGDLVRQRADGNLEFLSRVDTQIKIRGLRVEPAEIESALCRHPQIVHAAVTVHERSVDDRRLVGYLVAPSRTRISVADVRRFLGRELPPYLVPALFVQMDALPLTTNGKVDHDRLPPPGDERPELAEEFVLPQTPLEQRLAAIVAGVLNVTLVGRDDNFFELGGDSILAIQVVARAQEQDIALSPLDLFEHPTVALLARAAAGVQAERIVRPRAADSEPVLSFDQERLWIEDQLIPGAAYNVGGRQRLVGPLDVAALEASIRVVLLRHETLRSRFPAVDGRPVQVVDELDPGWHLPVTDLSQAPGDREAAARELMDGDAATGFDLVNGPLFRCLLIRLSDTEHLLHITSHHIAADVASMGLLARELAALYVAGGDPGRADLPALPVQYRDFAVWQRGWLAGEELRRQMDYWRGHLAGAPPQLTLPTARRYELDGAGSDRSSSALTGPETDALKEMCRRQGVTPFMVVLAALATVLGRWAGQSDVVVGVTISSRTAAGTENLIGCFVNTLPLRVGLGDDPTFAELLVRVRDVALGGHANADAPLDLLVKELQGNRDPRRTPLFQVILNVVDVPPVDRLGDVLLRPVSTPPLPSAFDLVLTTQVLRGALQIQMEWNAGWYEPEMMHTLSGHLGTLLRSVIDDASRRVLDYPLHTAEPVPAGPAPVRAIPAPHLAVARHAAGEDRVAVIDTDGEHSYRWLARTAARAARALAGRDEPVVLARGSSATFVAALLGCHQAGVTCTVIEPGATAGGAAVLDADTLTRGDDAPETAPALPPGPDRDWALERYGIGAADRVTVLSGHPGLLMAAVTTAAYAGAALVLPPEPFTRDVTALAARLRADAISVLYATPPILRALAARITEPLPALRTVFIDNAGELIAPDLEAFRGLCPTSRYVSLYRTGPDGRPTAVYTVPPEWQQRTAPLRVPLGTELPDAPVRLLLASGQLAAVGEVGEIWSGDEPTGDLGRRWADATIEFVGRARPDLERK